MKNLYLFLYATKHFIKQSFIKSSPAEVFTAGKLTGSLDAVVRFFVVVSTLAVVDCVALTVALCMFCNLYI